MTVTQPDPEALVVLRNPGDPNIFLEITATAEGFLCTTHAPGDGSHSGPLPGEATGDLVSAFALGIASLIGTQA